MDIQAVIEQYSPLVVGYAVKLLIAIIVFIVGKWLAKKITTILKASMLKGRVDETIVSFTGNLAFGLLMTLVIIASLAQIGIQTASFVAIIGAAGLAVGLALQGSLSNFASGVMIILFRPLKQGDFVEAGGVAGVVKDISIFVTTLTTGDNKTVVVPNSTIIGGPITNYSTQPTRRIDMIVGIAYDANIKLAKEILQQIADADARVLKDPAPMVAVSELANSSVNLVFRPWVNSSEYWPVRFDLTEQIKLRFDEAGIGIPFPQMDVHLYKD